MHWYMCGISHIIELRSCEKDEIMQKIKKAFFAAVLGCLWQRRRVYGRQVCD
jgi:hypothetical protein